MRKHSSSIASASFVFGLLGVAGCGADAGQAGNVDDEVGTVEQAQVTTWLPMRGTGTNYIVREGTSGYYAFRANAGAYVDALTFKYRLPSEGQTFRVGGFGGTDTGWLTCYDQDVAVGIDSSSGALLDRFALVCKSPGGALYGWQAGGDGGEANLDLCPSGMILGDVRIYTNRAYPGLISGIQGGCQ